MAHELDRILICCSDADFDKKMRKLHSKMVTAARFAGYGSEENQQVVDILRAVTEHGDKAVAQYTEKFDGVKLKPGQFRITKEELENAHSDIDRDILASLCQAIDNVRAYQQDILVNKGDMPRGIKYTPIRRVGVCVPGASAPLPSTVIMTAVPAQVAGVKEIAVVSPPRHEGSIHPVILAVCCELGIDEVYRIGGAQAVAALAIGTDTIGKVDKIVGPGNKWVQSAKKSVSGDYCGIDSIAGPSEVLIIANEQANPAWIAADMLSQAEHAADSSAIVVTDSQQLAQDTLAELQKQVAEIQRAKDALQSLKKFSAIVVVENIASAIEMADDFAPEHLEVQCGPDSREIAEKINNAGAIFVGSYSPVAVGDYWAGPSHTLPTGMRAKFASALTSNDFLKSISIIEYDPDMLTASAEDIARLAEIEGLDAHAKSVRIRQR
ncbi:MAG: histidinol dehydrogenase [Phycisphaerales bacterium]|nr:MAG: histidinol dehydrogenase [Phycisphaerales bacterium]UCF15893.1 MAG: histidinol dehydrogenase [Phycisphaerales bacterium]